MATTPKHRRSLSAWGRLIVPMLLSVLLLLLIIGTVLIVLGNLKIIPWPDNLNTILISIIIPDLGVIIALAQWLHSISSEKKEQPEKPASPTAPATSSPPPVQPEIQGLEHGKGSITKTTPQEEEEQVDLGEAPHVQHFAGRVNELAMIKRWIVDEHCRLVSVIGVGGIGKTSLVAKIIDQNPYVFRIVFWRSLLNAPPIERILQECLQFLTRGQQIEISQNTEELQRLLVAQLRQRRCLLVLDNAEAILKSGSSAGEYKDGYEDYGKLIRLLGETRHQSCVLVTSREQLREIAMLEGEGTPVRFYRLGGLKVEDARVILEKKGLSGEEPSWKALVERFSGNPMMLTFISPTIRETYRGLIAQYLTDFGDVPLNEYPELRVLLDRQFERLSFLEQQVIYWLAIEREAMSLQELRDTVVQSISKVNMLMAIEALQRRSWIEQSSSGRFTLQPAMMEAVTDRFNEIIAQEILTDKPELFASHTLIKAQTKAYIRQSQFQLILNVIAQKLFSALGQRKLEEKFRQRLVALRNLPEPPNNYEAGNILNMLVQTGYDLRGFDFSHLVVRQAYLQETNLPEVNFAHANLATSVFTDTFASILSVALSPHDDLLVIGTVTGEIRFWHTASGLPVQTLRGHADWVFSVAFSPDGKLLASSSFDQTVRLWEVSSGQCLKTLRGHASSVRSVAFSPDGRLLASGSDDQTARLWEVSSGQCLNTLHGHTNAVRAVAFSPDGLLLASGSYDQTVRLWEISSGQCLNTLYGHKNWIKSVAFSPDGRLLASGSDDQTVCLWEMSSGQCLNILQGHSHWVRSVAFSPDGRLLASGGDDQTVRLWEVSSGQCLNTLYGHANAIRAVAFSPDGKILASGSYDQTVHLWEVSSGQRLSTLRGYANAIRTVAFSPDGTILASGGDDQSVRLWDVNSGQSLNTLRSHTNAIWSVAFSPDGTILASGNEDRAVRLWEVDSGRHLGTLHGHTTAVWSVAFSPDGTILASGSFDQTVRLWQVSNGECLDTLHDYANAVWSVAFSPDGKLLASGSDDRAVRLWETSSGQCLTTLRDHDNAVRSVAFSPDGTILASGSDDQTVRLWQVSNGQCLNILSGHTSAIWALAFSPDGTILVSGSNDQTVRFWEVSSGQCLKILRGHSSEIWSVAFSFDGKTLASSSGDGVINFWDGQTGIYLRTLRSDRPYERMNITQVKGLTEVQKATLKSLGAIEDG